jgi:perosamine synthetase
MSSFIPVNEPLLNGNEKKYLSECIETGWISSEGPFVNRFEESLAARVGRKFGIAVANGSAALDIAVASLKLHKDDEIILPTFTIISCAAAIVRSGLKPVLVDSDPATWNMDVISIQKKITKHTKAIMAVHIYGLPVDMDPILSLAKDHGLKVIEDAAELIGQTYQGKCCGSFGDVSTFSFYPNKHITTGEGGMVLVDDVELAESCREFRNLCFGHKRFVHYDLGWNYRMTNLQAALGVAQLERLDEHLAIKRRVGQRYHSLLSEIPGLQVALAETNYAKNIYWVNGVVLDNTVSFDADEAARRLKAMQIGTRPFFWPMHEQPVFKKMGLFRNEKYPVAEHLARRGFYVPSGLALSDKQMDTVVESLRKVMAD